MTTVDFSKAHVADATGGSNVPRVQFLTDANQLDQLQFTNGMAAVEVPILVVHQIPFRNDKRERSGRLKRVERSVRNLGYNNAEPIICRVGAKGRWVVIDGGHRLNAARTVSAEWWTNLLSRKVHTLYFILFTSALSWSKLTGEPAEKWPDEHEHDALPG